MSSKTLFKVTQASSGEITLSQVSPSSTKSLPKASAASCAFNMNQKNYSAFIHADIKKIDIYENTTSSDDFFSLQASSKLDETIDFLEAFTIAGNIYFIGYATDSAYIHFYALQADFSLNLVYSGYIGSGYTMIKPLSYRNSIFFLAYNHTNGAVSKYQIMSTSTHPVYINETWSDTWAQQWHRFAFFQFGGENFFIKANTSHKKVNIDHLMDDLVEGSHPVLNESAPTYMLDAITAVSFQDQHGNAFIVVAQKSGELSINEIFPSCMGWKEQFSSNELTSINAVLPLNIDNDQYLLID